MTRRETDESRGAISSRAKTLAKFDTGVMDQKLRTLYKKIPRSAFRFPLAAVNRSVEGRFRFLLLYARKRSEKRPLGVRIRSIFEPFNKEGFNFTKVRADEIVCRLSDIIAKTTDDSPLIINNIPCTANHCLLTPQVTENLPQYLTPNGLKTALTALANLRQNSSFRMGFNSLAANASVNHLHFQLFDIAELSEENLLPVEKAFQMFVEAFPEIGVSEGSTVFSRTLSRHTRLDFLRNSKYYPMDVFRLWTASFQTEEGIELFGRRLSKIIEALQALKIAHNLMFSRLEGDHNFPAGNRPTSPHDNFSCLGERRLLEGKRKMDQDTLNAFIFPRRSVLEYRKGEPSVAFLECAGVFCVHSERDFEKMGQGDLEALLGKCCLKQHNIDALVEKLEAVFCK